MALLRDGELTVHGRITDASNAAFYCTVSAPATGGATGGARSGPDGDSAICVYKPVRGERPLWDFPDGTLAGRETAAYLVSAAMGWGLVPPTSLREGPFGEGMCQIWVEPDPEAPELLSLQPGEEAEPGWRAIGLAEVEPGRTALFVHADDERLRRLAVLDAVLNNGDRKGGHLLTAADGRLYGIDHGVTFAVPGKLRTLLWGWAGEPLAPEATEALGRLRADLDGALGAALAPLLTPAEIAATAGRVDGLLKEGHHPYPSADWPAVPWPPI
ncbi:SCO1664 family protein [Streptacidiphilus neutrinimicus]|uniref:SCO1664 family protein n=1 Tax=Streptacidiphilus neutrinimicus TaxID=105420 RepID=UPI0005A9F3C2|nr:SCO1664 family protein [Streptacidiphilus neutrinimicus]